jgi:hypothetical protein
MRLCVRRRDYRDNRWIASVFRLPSEAADEAQGRLEAQTMECTRLRDSQELFLFVCGCGHADDTPDSINTVQTSWSHTASC